MERKEKRAEKSQANSVECAKCQSEVDRFLYDKSFTALSQSFRVKLGRKEILCVGGGGKNCDFSFPSIFVDGNNLNISMNIEECLGLKCLIYFYRNLFREREFLISSIA